MKLNRVTIYSILTILILSIFIVNTSSQDEDTSKKFEDIYKLAKDSKDPIIYENLKIKSGKKILDFKDVKVYIKKDIIGDEIGLAFESKNDNSVISINGNPIRFKTGGDVVLLEKSGKIVKGFFITGKPLEGDFSEVKIRGTKFRFPEGSRVRFGIDIVTREMMFKVEAPDDKSIEIEHGGWKFKVPPGGTTKFDYDVSKEGEVAYTIRIYYSSDQKLLLPEIVDKKHGDVNFEFITGGQYGEKGKGKSFKIGEENSFFELSYDKKGNLVEGITTLFYNEGRGLYFNGVNAVIKDKDGNMDIKIHNPASHVDSLQLEAQTLSSPANYLRLIDTEPKINSNLDYNSNYIFWDKNKIIINSPKANGVAVSFDKGNKRGFLLDGENSVAFQSNIGKIEIKNGKIPEVKLSGRSIMSLNSKSLIAQEDHLYFDPTHSNIEGFESKKFSTNAKISLVDNKGDRISKFDIYSNDKNQYFSRGPDSNSKDSKLTINELTSTSKKIYNGLTDNNKNQYFTINENEGNVILEQLMVKLDSPAKKFIDASVRVTGPGRSYGSGTIIGYDDKGYAIVLTAGHLRSASSPGNQQEILFSDGTKYRATTISGVDNTDIQQDISILRINEKKILPYISLAPGDIKIEKYTNAISLGPGPGDFGPTQLKVYEGNDFIIGKTKLPRGTSGGSIIQNGKIIGIVVQNELNGGVVDIIKIKDINNFLRKNGYGYLTRVSSVLVSYLS
jgi:hypothetical protein